MSRATRAISSALPQFVALDQRDHFGRLRKAKLFGRLRKRERDHSIHRNLRFRMFVVAYEAVSEPVLKAAARSRTCRRVTSSRSTSLRERIFCRHPAVI